MVEPKNHASRPPLTEPVVVPCLFVEGFAVTSTDAVVRIVGWAEMPNIGGEMDERRIVVRIAITDRAARDLAGQLRRLLAGRGH